MNAARRTDCSAARPRGVALLMVLWLIMLMSVLASGAVRVVGAETRSLKTHLDRSEARAIAEAGVSRAILDLVSLERRWQTDGSQKSFEFAGQTILVGIRSAGGLVDLNRADGPLIEGLLQLAGLDDPGRKELAAAVLDWRDADDFVRLNGAEAADYVVAGLGWRPRNAPFQSIEELRYVRGMTADIFQAVAPYLSVHSRRSGLELENAPPELVEVLTGRQIVSEDDTALTTGARARGTFHIIVNVPFGKSAELELVTVVRLGGDKGRCCRTLAQRERIVSASQREEMSLL